MGYGQIARGERSEKRELTSQNRRAQNLSQSPSACSGLAMLEGPVALTECQIGPSLCRHQGSCLVEEPWSVINTAVQNTLSTITLADLISPAFPKSTSILSLTDSARPRTESLPQAAE